MKSKRLSDLGEKELIRRIASFLKTDRRVVKGIGDDCAVLEGFGGKLLLFACDMLVEGVHFLGSAKPESVGWKALAVNVSDIAAMGGIPHHAVISLGLPRSTPIPWIDRLYGGFARCAREFGVNIVGGDTNRSEKKVIDVAILGQVERNRVIYRSGARVGDLLFVTGRLGGSVRSGRHLTFVPRVREARAIAARVKPHAMIDLSDGLGPDLTRLCEASKVAALLEADRIPRKKGTSLDSALTEGEDFELLMAIGPREAAAVLSWARRNLSCGLTHIGKVVRPQKANLVRVSVPRGMKTPSLTGFQHF